MIKHWVFTLCVITAALVFGLLDIQSVGASAELSAKQISVKRLQGNPIISPELNETLGENIQGPSLIRVPEWIENPLGKYYLYFADHKGRYIRLAYADQLSGPWKIYEPGTLQLNQTDFPQQPLQATMLQNLIVNIKMKLMGVDANDFPHDILKDLTIPHIASPDVHVDAESKRIVMYFHGLKEFAKQVSRVAISHDGIVFSPRAEDLGKTYMRTFEHEGSTYALAMPGQFYRSRDGLSNFEKGPLLFNKDMRHAGLLTRGNRLFVFWTQVGDSPERILMSSIDISKPWLDWRESNPVEVLRPEFAWEGADVPAKPSMRSVAYGRVNQLRDPYVFQEDGKIYLLYSVAGERGVAIAELDLDGF